MTENKRFRISQGYTDRFCHDWQNNQLLNFRETVELLNELHEENKKLRKENASLIEGVKNTARQGADTIVKVWESKNEAKTITKGYYD